MKVNRVERLTKIKEYLLTHCDICKGAGFISETKKCECLKKFDFYVACEYAGIDQEHWDLEIDDFKGDKVALGYIRKYIDNIDNAYTHGLGMVLFGSNGTGKTMLAVIALKAAMRKDYEVHLTTLDELLILVRDSFKNSEKRDYYDAKIKEADFLVLDEVGNEFRFKDMDPFIIAKFGELARFRRKNYLPTIITTNLATQADFEQIYGTTIKSLFVSVSKFISVSGLDFRNVQGTQWDKLLEKK